MLLRLPSHFSYSLFSKLQTSLLHPERLGPSVQFQLSYCGSAPPPPAYLLTLLLDGMLVPSATGSWVSWCLLALAGVAPSLGMLPFLVPCQNPLGALCPHRLVRMDFVFLCALWHLVLIWYSILHCLTQVVSLCLLLSLSFTWTAKSWSWPGLYMSFCKPAPMALLLTEEHSVKGYGIQLVINKNEAHCINQ